MKRFLNPARCLLSNVLLLCLACNAIADDDAEQLIFDRLSVARFSPIDPEYGKLREELVGVIIDHRTSIDISVFRHDDKFFLPVSLLEKLGVSISVKGDQLYLGTPGGE
ncbi:MAG: hypothetical protein ACE1ZA_02955, partial [Pseudomonadales bacterium]